MVNKDTSEQWTSTQQLSQHINAHLTLLASLATTLTGSARYRNRPVYAQLIFRPGLVTYTVRSPDKQNLRNLRAQLDPMPGTLIHYRKDSDTMKVHIFNLTNPEMATQMASAKPTDQIAILTYFLSTVNNEEKADANPQELRRADVKLRSDFIGPTFTPDDEYYGIEPYLDYPTVQSIQLPPKDQQAVLYWEMKTLKGTANQPRYFGILEETPVDADANTFFVKNKTWHFNFSKAFNDVRRLQELEDEPSEEDDKTLHSRSIPSVFYLYGQPIGQGTEIQSPIQIYDDDIDMTIYDRKYEPEAPSPMIGPLVTLTRPTISQQVDEPTSSQPTTNL